MAQRKYPSMKQGKPSCSCEVACLCLSQGDPDVCLQSAATELQSVEATLDAVLYNGTTNATALAAEINAATQNITVTPFPPSTLTALNNSQVDSAFQTIQSLSKVGAI